ncbi:hypothetical protein FRX31_034131 [Thalictrum thalictroides]|uniref:Uncharacterized protein n=1 Tax=Thalictrum thalictroides TaxID=46969 RepID=A0A7J6UVP9_THATH|nr:hypothetical protein FRX31_034131 [Thalictrum thalictroides]
MIFLLGLSQRIVSEAKSDNQPLSQRLRRSSSSPMETSDFDLSGVQIDLTQFDDVSIEEDQPGDHLIVSSYEDSILEAELCCVETN